MKRDYHRRLILIGWLFFTVTVLYIWLCFWLPKSLQLPLIMLSAVFTVPLTMEFSFRGMILHVLGVSIIGAFWFGVGAMAPYMFFLGFYPPLKFLCEQQGGVMGYAAKLMVFCFAFGLIMRLFPSPLFIVYDGLSVTLLVPMFIAMFVVTDLAVALFAAAYNSLWRKKLL
jgi:hypothetical protein